mgnify:CR=1 FL=1
MRSAFLASLFAHVALLAALLITLPTATPMATPGVDALPVELVTIADETDLAIGDELATEVVETPSPETVEAPEPATETPGANNQEADTVARDADAIVSSEQSAAPEPAAAETPPEPEAAEPQEETEVAAIAPEPARVPETVTPRRRPPPPPRQTARAQAASESAFDADRLSNLINRADNSGGGSGGGQASIGSATGRQSAALTLSEKDALRAQMQRCWSPPIGLALGASEIVALKIELSVEGNVDELETMPGRGSGVLYDAAVSSARRAVLTCQPYTLPVAKYDLWKSVLVTFDPRDLY